MDYAHEKIKVFRAQQHGTAIPAKEIGDVYQHLESERCRRYSKRLPMRSGGARANLILKNNKDHRPGTCLEYDQFNLQTELRCVCRSRKMLNARVDYFPDILAVLGAQSDRRLKSQEPDLRAIYLSELVCRIQLVQRDIAGENEGSTLKTRQSYGRWPSRPDSLAAVPWIRRTKLIRTF